MRFSMHSRCSAIFLHGPFSWMNRMMDLMCLESMVQHNKVHHTSIWMKKDECSRRDSNPGNELGRLRS